ncbi:EAL domain-containing protein [Marinobacter sp. NFXS9]|uniref:sensor domain-containing protein n=1 Tax=Marinobacter sp. NFXS9 TaxID=2818433 RepID=UPI0032DF8D4A
MDNAECNLFPDPAHAWDVLCSQYQGLTGRSLKHFLETTIDTSPLGIWVTDADNRCIYTNRAFQTLAGRSAEQSLGRTELSYLHPIDRQYVTNVRQSDPTDKTVLRMKARLLRPDGETVWVRINIVDCQAVSTVLGQIHMLEDISDQKHLGIQLGTSEKTLFEERACTEVILDAIGDAVLTTDIRGDVTYLNRMAESMTGWSLAEARGRSLAEVLHLIESQTRLPASNPAVRAMHEDRMVEFETDCVLVQRDGREAPIEDSASPIHGRYGEVIGAVIVFHDVTQPRAMMSELAFLAHHDFLTGLPNRALLAERSEQAIGQASRHGKQVALLFLDVDFFKKINDSLGHAVGDQVLQTVAGRLVQCVRNTDTVSRQGGDEFVVLLAEIAGPSEAARVAEKLMSVFTEDQLLEGHEIQLTLSIGISVFPTDGDDVDTIMQNADTAMYHAKAQGRNNYQFFETELNIRAIERLNLESGLRRALRQEEFELVFQPQIELATDSMIGAEVLIRWRHPVRGLLLPGQFIPIAEDCGLIIRIGHWVLHETCRQIRAWLDKGLAVVPLAINISAVEFNQYHFAERVQRILHETGVDARYVQIEITESLLMLDSEVSVNTLNALDAMGIKLAIDDFGTGYSSLSYIKRFPVQTLKIDQSFVRDIIIDEDDATIVTAVIGMGQNLKLKTLAEGVETDAQLDYLRAGGCDIAQGFYFSGPLLPEQFEQHLLPSSATR